MGDLQPETVPASGGPIADPDLEPSDLADDVPDPDGSNTTDEPAAGPPIARPGIETLEGLQPKVTEEHFTVRSRDNRPDIAADAFAIAGTAVRAASVRGIAHRYYGDPRQDAYAVRVSDDGRWLVIAIADGLSSCANSHEGSELAARTAVRFAAGAATHTDLVGVDWARLFDAVSTRIGDRARRLADTSTDVRQADELRASEQAASSMSTTLTVLAVPLANEPTRNAIAAWVGDSGVWRLRNGRWQDVTPLKGGPEPISSSTVDALPWANGGEPGVVEFPIDPGDVVMVATDGIGDLLGGGDTRQAAFFADRWAEPPAAAQFIAEVDLRVQSFDDDRTAVATWIPGLQSHAGLSGTSWHQEWSPPEVVAAEDGESTPCPEPVPWGD